MPDDAPDPCPPFIPVGDYAHPSTPADERARQIVAWFHAIWRQEDDVAAPPACGPVMAEL